MLQRWKEKVPHSHCTLWNFKSLVSGLALNEGGQNIDHYHEGEACCFHRSPDPIPLLRSIILYNLTWAQHGPAFFIGKRCCVQLMHWFRNDPRSSVFDLFIPFKAYFMHLVQTNMVLGAVKNFRPSLLGGNFGFTYASSKLCGIPLCFRGVQSTKMELRLEQLASWCHLARANMMPICRSTC